MNPQIESQLGHITFMDIDHEIVSMIILPFPLIGEESLQKHAYSNI